MKYDLFQMTTAIFIAGAFAATGHAAPVEVSEAEVRQCRMLSKVVGSSGYGKKSAWRPAARENAMRKAGAEGATHVVFTGMRAVGVFNGVARAQAYACP